MGCVSSNLLNHDDEFPQLGSSSLGHHIVSLTSTTYGLLNLDPPSSSTPPSLSQPRILRSQPEVINSWELMAGLDTQSFRFPTKDPNFNKENNNPSFHFPTKDPSFNKENNNPSFGFPIKDPNFDKENNNNGLSFGFPIKGSNFSEESNKFNEIKKPILVNSLLDGFEVMCPPNGEERVVIYTTTLRGVRKTFEDCNEVRRVMEGFGVVISERDVSMDCGFKEELKEMLKGKEGIMVLPRVFVKGRYIGGVEEVLRLDEEGMLGKILEGLPRKKEGAVCEGCGDMRFLPCFHCHGSCKMVMVVKEKGGTIVVRCPHCNENGLVMCPLCC